MAESLDLHLPPARQSRSKETFERVLGAFTDMLSTTPFDKITMAELARRSQTSLPSIYARFSDKNALLLAAHQRYLESLDAQLVGARSGESLEDYLGRLANVLCNIYSTHRNLLRGVLLSDSAVLYERATTRFDLFAHELANTFVTFIPEVTAEAATKQASSVTSVIFALLHQQLIFGQASLAIKKSRAELAEIIAGHLVNSADALRRTAL